MINILAKAKKIFILLPMVSFVIFSCHNTNKINAESTPVPVVTPDDTTEATDDDDEEYDSSNAYSQDNDSP